MVKNSVDCLRRPSMTRTAPGDLDAAEIHEVVILEEGQVPGDGLGAEKDGRSVGDGLHEAGPAGGVFRFLEEQAGRGEREGRKADER